MITPFDDYPIHQTAEPVAHPASADPNHYDRYFFNGYTPDGAVFFGGAMAHYPNRGLIDAAFSVVVDGVERSVFASGTMPADRATRIGPVSVEIVEPLRSVRFAVDPNEHGLAADLRFEARTAVIEEPRNTIVRGARRLMDVTRLTQWGTWAGQIEVDGARLTVDARTARGTRDRSWGQRTVGAQVPTLFTGELPQIFWLWAPLHFERFCTHLALFEHADGERWLEQCLRIPVIGAADPTWGEAAGPEHLAGVDYDVRWAKGTRVIEAAALTMRGRDGAATEVELEPILTFRMRGIGYTHPTWGHGSLHGPLAVGGESTPLDAFDPADPTCIHVQTLCRATCGGEVGIGVLEQLAFGDHEPTGLRGFTDGFQPA